MKFILSIIALILLINCGNTPPPVLPEGENVVYCEHKHDSKINFYYLPKNMISFTQNKVLQFQIITLNNEEIFLNIYEIENYNCMEVQNGNEN